LNRLNIGAPFLIKAICKMHSKTTFKTAQEMFVIIITETIDITMM